MINLKKTNRILAFVLAISMLISLWPTSVLADDAVTADAVVYKHTNAPGQFTNDAIGTDKNGTLNASTGMVSLGAYGGNISWKFTNPIKNDKKNPYGVDFILYGNAFSGNEEPGGVEVAQDKNNDGVPDKWYEIANSEYFENSTLHNYSVTYTNPDTTFTQTLAVPWTDNLGGSGMIATNSFYNHAYYPNPANYDDVDLNSLTLSGTKIATRDVAFGCVDVHENGTIDNEAGNPYIETPNKGDGIDISWAVDENNEPIHLDEISFVKAYNNVQMSSALGEVGPEVSYITRAKSADTEVGTTDDVSAITIGGKTLSLTASVYDYDVNEPSDSFDISVKASADNVFINNTRATTLSVNYGDQTERTVRVIAQTGEKEPVTYFLHIHKQAKNEKTLTVRVEGAKQNICYDKSFIVQADGDKELTALDAVEQALNASNIAYTEVGGYLTSIGGETAGSYGGYDGWMFEVNNVSPSVGMGTYKVQNNDNLVVYYGDTSTAYPLITTTQTRDAITLTCRYNGYDENWNPVNLPLSGAAITLNGKSYTTDENGVATIAVTDDMRGNSYVLGISKTTESGLQQVVRLASDERLTVQELKNEKTITVRVEGAKQNIYYGKSFTVKVDSDKEPTALDALQQVLDTAKIPYALNGGYLTTIGGETAGSYGGWDGWMFEVNDVSPSVGMDTYKVQNNDDLVVYYGDTSTAYPHIKATQTRNAITLTCRYDGYDENWNPVNLPLSSATITLNGRSYTTDENGVATIAVTDDMRGNSYVLGISKTAESGLPQVVRLASDEELTVVPLQKLTADNAQIAVEQTPIFVNVPENVNGVLKLTPTTSNDKKTAVLPKIEAEKAIGDTVISLDVAEGTAVTGSSVWDGNVKLPSIITNPTISGVTISSAVKVGADVNLTFDKPVRLLLPNVGDKKVGFIDASGALHEINTTLTSDSSDALGTNEEGKIVVADDAVIWTKHFTTFVVYSVNSTDSSGGSSNQDMKVSVSVIGDTKKGSILPKTTVTVSKNATAWAAIKEALDAADIEYEYTSGYISSVDGLSEFDNGNTSGWMYYVNGSEPKVGMNQYKLVSGDVVTLKYVTTFTDSPSSGGSSGSGSSSSSTTTAPTTSTSAIDISKVLASIQVKSELSIWEMFVLAQNDLTVSDKNLTDLEATYKENAGEYRLVTDYAKLAIILKAMGKSATEFAGYPLLSKVYNSSDLGKQGSNGYIYSLLALSSQTIPSSATWTQEKIIQKLLTYQKADGGFALTSTGSSDIDVTAMAISALAPYKAQESVNTVIDKAISYLKNAQGTDGDFAYNGEKTSETLAQVIIALSSLGMDAASADFTKSGKTLIDILLSYQLSDKTFVHTSGGTSNSIATEQAVMALTAYNRYVEEKSGIFEFSNDSNDFSDTSTFSDIKQGDWYYSAVKFVSAKGLTSGVGNKQFAPNEAVTRRQFIKMLCDAYGIKKVSTGDNFADCGSTWYTPYLAAIKQQGISQGVGENKFDPEKAITREEMFTLLYNVLKTLNKVPEGTGKDMGTFSDGADISAWANEAFTVLVQNGIVSGTDDKLNPKSGANRAQMAQIFYCLLANQNS